MAEKPYELFRDCTDALFTLSSSPNEADQKVASMLVATFLHDIHRIADALSGPGVREVKR